MTKSPPSPGPLSYEAPRDLGTATRSADLAIPERPVRLSQVHLAAFGSEVFIEGSRLHRLVSGQVVLASGHVLIELGTGARATPLDAVVAAVRPALGDFGAIGGAWPGVLTIETFRLGPPGGDPHATSFLVRSDATHPGAIKVQRTTGAYWLPPLRWRDGALLTVRAQGYSGTFGEAVERTARFEVLDATPTALPRFPKDALFGDAFAAYPDGRVFALGGRRSRPVIEAEASEYEQEHGYMLDEALVWQTEKGGSELRAQALPETRPRDRLRSGQLVTGTSETETLVFGTLEVWKDRQSTSQPYLARMGPSGWRRVPIDLPILRAQVGSDGSAWAIRGSDGYAPDAEAFLERMSFTADGGVKFERTSLVVRPEPEPGRGPEAAQPVRCTKLRPRELAVLRAQELWLTAQCLDERGAATTLLLHAPPSSPPG